MRKKRKMVKLNHNLAFFVQREKNKGRGRSFSPRGRGFHQGKHQNVSFHDNNLTQKQYGSQQQSDNFNHHEMSTQDKGTCQICGKPNHSALECRSRFNHADQPNDIPKALAALCINNPMHENFYRLLRRATTHTLNDHGKLTIKNTYNGNEKLYVGNGEALDITHIGNGKITNRQTDIHLKNVLIVRDMEKNLLSVSRLTHDNDYCSIILLLITLLLRMLRGQSWERDANMKVYMPWKNTSNSQHTWPLQRHHILFGISE